MKASKAIQLVLIGSAAILLGCLGCNDQQNATTTTQPAGRSGWLWWGRPARYSGGSGFTQRPGHSASSRGGFGSSGRHVGS